MQIEKLRKRCKKLMVDLEIDGRGQQPIIAKHMNINRNSLCMALSGYREGPGSEKILKDLLGYLKEIQCR